MFCMSCGTELPEGARFCLKCGTPQGEVTPSKTNISNSINIGNNAFVPAICPNCSSHLRVDSTAKIARCEFCGTECLVQDAIKALSVRGNVHVGNATINVNGTNIQSLLNRVEMMLADGDFIGAVQKCDSILDIDPKEGRVYLYLLMAELRCRRRMDLSSQIVSFANNKNYIKAMRFGDAELKDELNGYLEYINASIDKRLMNPQRDTEFYFGTMDGQRLWWKVLMVRERTALVISKTAVCNAQFNMYQGPAFWNKCTLRSWLNNTFYSSCFSSFERPRINSINIDYNTNVTEWVPGSNNASMEKVFLLSAYEAKWMFPNDNSRALGYIWWLRSPDGLRISGVSNFGVINKSGFRPEEFHGVRPAMWINLP